MVKISLHSSEFELIMEKLDGQTKLINAQFMNVDAQFMKVDKRLDGINGKVGKHDEQINEALIERAKNRQEQKDQNEKLDEVVKLVDKIKDIEASHFMTCPQSIKVRELEDAMLKQDTKDESKSLIFGRTAQIIIIFIMFSGLTTSLIFSIANYKKKSEVQFAPLDAQSKFRGFPLDPVYYNDSLNPAPKYEIE